MASVQALPEIDLEELVRKVLALEGQLSHLLEPGAGHANQLKAIHGRPSK